MENTHFKHLFYFCVGVFAVSFSAMMLLLFVEIPEANREMASNAQGFLQGSLIMSAVGYLLTGNIKTSLNKVIPPEGTTTADINISATTITDSKKEQDDKGTD